LLNLIPVFSQAANDFPAYYDGAQRVISGQPLYELDRLRKEPFSATYKYHPLFIGFVIPLTLVPLDTAIMLWRGLGVALMVGSIAMILLAQPSHIRRQLIVPALVFGTNLAPIARTLWLGQIDLLLLFGIVAALSSFRRYPWLSAGIWATLGLVKIYPLFLLLPALFQRAWRWLALVAGMLLLGIGTSLAFGWENQLTFWERVVPMLGERNGLLANQSLYGMIVRSLDPRIILKPGTLLATPGATLAFLALVAAIVGSTIWLLPRLRHELWEATSLALCTALLILPVSWDHYQAILLLPLLLGVAHTLSSPHRRTLWLVAAYAMLAFGTIKNLWLGFLEPTTLGLLFAAYRTLGLLLLWGWWACYALDRTPRTSRIRQDS
jgi:hypothetical protein